MGGGGHGMGGSSASPAQFARSLADIVGVFPDRGGVDSFPTLGLRLKSDDAGLPVVSMVWPDTVAAEVGFERGDVVLDVNGATPSDLAGLRFLLASLEWSERVGLKVRRDDEVVEVAALLFPDVDSTEVSIAPGHDIEQLRPFDTTSSTAADDRVVPEAEPVWTLVTDDELSKRAEVRVGGVLDQVHELDEHGRVTRSLFRAPRTDGSVELRHHRDRTGEIEKTIRFDRIGGKLD
jgi:hypothetical protein